MIGFESPNAFYVLALLFIVFVVGRSAKSFDHVFSKSMFEKIVIGKNRYKIKMVLLISSFILLVVSLAQPIIPKEPIKIKQSNVSFVTAFDISKSMNSEDIFPNRLEFAKEKFYTLVDNLKDEKIGVIGFSKDAFLVSPITNDYGTLKYLVKNINQSMISTKGSSVKQAIVAANELLKDDQRKAIIVFTDGTDQNEFEDTIEYAQDNNLRVFIYGIATKNGGTIKNDDGSLIKDDNNNIVISSLNENIKELAFETNGAYLKYSSSNNDMKSFISAIKKSFTSKEKQSIVVNTSKQLFIYPLILSFVLFMLAVSGFKRSQR
jgi:Ca-activated chloride channel family protein